MAQQIHVQVMEANALQVECDVLVLKYAQAHYGLDALVANGLLDAGENPEYLHPNPEGFRLLDSRSTLAAPQVLLVGVAPLSEFGYVDIRKFARRALTALAGATPEAQHLAMTVHGVMNGLDESEAFDAQLAGIVDPSRPRICRRDCVKYQSSR